MTRIVEKFARSFQMYSCKSKAVGAGITEYILIAFFVLLVMVGVFVQLGGGLGNLFAMFKGDMNRAIMASRAANAPPPPPPPAASPAPGDPPPPAGTPVPEGTPGSVCVNGSCVSVPPSLAGASVTLGSNGVELVSMVGQIADLYADLANLIKNDPNADPMLGQLLTELAQNGHANANVQTTMLKFTDPSVSASQKTSTMSDFTNSYGDFNALASKIQPYLGSISPDKADLISNATTVISTIMDNVNSVVQTGKMDSYDDTIRPGNIDLQHSQSNTICQNGGSPPDCIQ